MDRRIVWSVQADRQFRSCLRYWLDRNKSPAYPLELIAMADYRLRAAITYPHSRKATKTKGIFYCSVRAYRIFFEFQGDDAHVLYFWDARRKPDKLPKKYRRK